MADIKEYIGWRILNRKKKGFNRQVKVHNFDTAKSAVVLFDTNNPSAFASIKEFRKYLESKGILCKAFGFVRQKEIPQEMLFWKSYSFITRNDIKWYHMPFGEVVDSFYNQDPDMLIDLTGDDSLELQYLVHLSTARFKIGIFTENENDYDLMINLTKQKDIGYLTEQIKHYVSMLNS